jgi:hypothetical protein
MHAVAEALKSQHEPAPEYEPYYPGVCCPQVGTLRPLNALPTVSAGMFAALSGCRSVDCYTYVDRVDEGQYGVVYKAKDNLSSDLVWLVSLRHPPLLVPALVVVTHD